MAKGKKTGGRVKGSKNRGTLDIEAKLRGLRCDPITGMARIALGIDAAGNALEPLPSIDLKARMFAELAQYIAPKRKAMEVTGADGGALVVEVVKYAVKGEK